MPVADVATFRPADGQQETNAMLLLEPVVLAAA